MNVLSRTPFRLLLLGQLLVSCDGRQSKDKAPEENAPVTASPEVPSNPPSPERNCLATQSCIDSAQPFLLGETVPTSRPKIGSIGRKDDISASGELLAEGVEEVKTLYGADRVIDWSGLDFITKQSSTLNKVQTDVILQAFNMSYGYIEKQLDHLQQAGYNIIQISPPQQTLDRYGIWWEGYQPVDNRVFANKLGTEAELRSMIQGAHKRGIRVIADTVLNHMADPLRYGRNNPLQYSDLYSPKDFANFDLYTDLLQYKLQILNSNINEFLYFYSPERALYKRFQSFLYARNLDIKKVLANASERSAFELAFVKDELPWMYADLKRIVGYAGVSIRFDGDTAVCSQYGQPMACAKNVSFSKQWAALFGSGALIVRSYYFELTADKYPIYENEWDNLEKVLVKWYPGLPSLDKGSAYVQETHVDLLEKMVRVGIDGFRLDAVKHIPKDYFADLIVQLQQRLKDSSETVDGELLQNKALYVYGEMATSKADIANYYRDGMDVTDFFLLDTFMYATVFKESFDLYGRGEENLQKLRRKSLLASVQSGNNKDWQLMLHPMSRSKDQSWFVLKEFDKDIYMKQLKTPIYFSRIHDSVVGDMFILKNYQQAMLGHAYMLSATEGRTLVYASDEDVAINAGADYKEKVVLAGMKFRQIAGSYAYTDRFENSEYCKECSRKDMLFVDRGDSAVAILYSGLQPLAIESLKLPGLQKGCYVELMSGRRFTVDADHLATRGGTSALTIPARSAAYVVATACDVQEKNSYPVPGEAEAVDVEEETSIDYPIYLRGSLNGWKADAAYAFLESEDKCLVLTASLPRGTSEFKIADDKWKKMDAGTKGLDALVLGKSVKLTNKFSEGNITPENLKIDMEEAAKVEFKLCEVSKNFPVLTLRTL